MSHASEIEEQAALWVLRREEPFWSSADQEELDCWLAQSDRHKVAFWRLEHVARSGQDRFDRRSFTGSGTAVQASGLVEAVRCRGIAVAGVRRIIAAANGLSVRSRPANRQDRVSRPPLVATRWPACRMEAGWN